MIHWFTSTTERWERILDAAQRFWIEHVHCAEGRAATMVVEAPHMIPRRQAVWADEIIDMHRQSPQRKIIVASTSELAILRILRRIGEESGRGPDPQTDLFQAPSAWMRADAFRTHVLTGRGPSWGESSAKVRVQVLRATDSGDYLDVWPDGFFDERMEELF